MRVCQFRHFGIIRATPGTGVRNYLAGSTILQYVQLMSNSRNSLPINSPNSYRSQKKKLACSELPSLERL
jgi:hypothetical protein